MKYVNREMKVDQIIGYFNTHKINLIPPFQRGTVWNLALRQRLIENMVQSRPIPAVFLYKQADGPQFAYNILDGKQRLESLILFVGDKRVGHEMRVKNVRDYFYGKPAAKNANFEIKLDGQMVSFENLENGLVRAFREYAIPTIEIDLDDESISIDEIINLFIDINQYGVKVSRFDVVKAMRKNPLISQVFDLIAVEQNRKNKKSIYYKAKRNNFVFVLKRLNIVSRLTDKNSKVDRMWERLTEIALFTRAQKHRAPAAILKGFIKSGDETNERLNKGEQHKLLAAFDFLACAYRKVPELMVRKIATDQPKFYTTVTSLLSSNLMVRYLPEELVRKVNAVSEIIEGKVAAPGELAATIKEYMELATKQTTNPDRRERRQNLFIQAIDAA